MDKHYDSKVSISDTTIYGGGDADAKKELALALRSMGEAAKALAERMSSESYGIYIEGDRINNHPGTLSSEPGADDDDYEEPSA